jgi:hypothetical protein
VTQHICKTAALLMLVLAGTIAAADSIPYAPGSRDRIVQYVTPVSAINVADPFVQRLTPYFRSHAQTSQLLFLKLGDVQQSSIIGKGSFLDAVMSFIEHHLLNKGAQAGTQFCAQHPEVYACQR